MTSKANVSARVGMVVVVISSVLVLVAMGFMKFAARALGGADGKDDQNQLAWFAAFAVVLVVCLCLFCIFKRISKKTALAVPLPKPESIFYLGIAATGAAAVIFQSVSLKGSAGSASLILVFPILLATAVFENRQSAKG